MKVLFFVFLLFAAPAIEASTIMISLTGRVSATEAAAFFPLAPVSVGDPWSVRIIYSHPSPFDPDAGGIATNVYRVFTGTLEFQVNNLFWTGQGFGASANFREPQIGDVVNFSSSQSVPLAISPGGEDSVTYLTFNVPTGTIADPASLPDSFAAWNLPAATSFSLNVVSRRFSAPAPNNLWSIRATSWDTISIQVIPEPAAASLAGAVALVVLTRRRRVRA